MSEPSAAAQSPVLDSTFVARALGGLLRERSGPEATFGRAIIDSREARAGDLFVALPGDHTDGHEHAATAVAAGASGVILERPIAGIDAAAQFHVTDALRALQTAATAWRNALPSTQVVGITGNVGKTTTKVITAAILGAHYRVQVNEANYNNEIGVPLCLLELRPDTERAVIEMGMYTTGEIALLCEWTDPRIGVVLNVGPVHLERAGSMQVIIEAKRELVEALPAEGHALLNADDPDVLAMASHTPAPVTLFGLGPDAAVRGCAVRSLGASGFEFTLTAAGESRPVRVPLPGAHLVSNVLAAIAVALADGMALDEVVAAVEHLDVPVRLRVRELAGGVTLLDDTYNANPASMRAALDLLAELPGRRLALLGDMRELGDETDAAHEEIGRRAAAVLDSLLTVGELAERISATASAAGLERTSHLDGKAGAAAALIDQLEPGDVVLIKGSHALALETVVDELEQALRARGEQHS